MNTQILRCFKKTYSKISIQIAFLFFYSEFYFQSQPTYDLILLIRRLTNQMYLSIILKLFENVSKNSSFKLSENRVIYNRRETFEFKWNTSRILQHTSMYTHFCKWLHILTYSMILVTHTLHRIPSSRFDFYAHDTQNPIFN